MKIEGRMPLRLTSWILAVALTVSPVMAQNTPVPGVKPIASQHDDGTSNETALPLDAPAAVPEGSGDAGLETALVPESRVEKAVSEAPRVDPGSTREAVPLGQKHSSSTSAGGESKWIITATAIAAAVVVGIILLLRGGGHKSSGDKSTNEGPVGTIITAGPPAVGPNH